MNDSISSQLSDKTVGAGRNVDVQPRIAAGLPYPIVRPSYPGSTANTFDEKAKMKQWSSYLFIWSDWTDRNNDGRVQKEELDPGDDKRFNEISSKYDEDRNGLSFEEVKKYFNPSSPVDLDYDLSSVADGLAAKGEYCDPSRPVLFVTPDRIPDQIRRLPGYSVTIDKWLKTGSFQLNCSREKGVLGPVNTEGRTKYVVIVARDARTQNKWDAEEAVAHELVHAKQYLTGQLSSYRSILHLLRESGRINEEEVKKLGDDIPQAICEIEAYKKGLLMSIRDGKPGMAANNCMNINSYISALETAIQDLDRRGETDAKNAILENAQEVLSKEEIEYLNKQGKCAINGGAIFR